MNSPTQATQAALDVEERDAIDPFAVALLRRIEALEAEVLELRHWREYHVREGALDSLAIHGQLDQFEKNLDHVASMVGLYRE